MSTKSRGNKGENIVKKMLEAEGYLVDSKPNVRFHSPDLFGMFDLVAIKGINVRWIQVKYEKKYSHFYTARKEIVKFMEENQLDINVEVWGYDKSRKRWRKEGWVMGEWRPIY